jgi:uncharacterized membrane protein
MSRDLQRLESVIGTIMRAGVWLSALAFVAGLVLLAFGYPQATRVLNGGLVLLMAIPAARILVSFGDALARRDRLLAVSTAIVFFVLLWQIVW